MKKTLLITLLCFTAFPALAATHAATPAAAAPVATTTTAPTVVNTTGTTNPPPLATSSPASPTNNLPPAYPQQIIVPAGSGASTVPGQSGNVVNTVGTTAPTGTTTVVGPNGQLEIVPTTTTGQPVTTPGQTVTNATTPSGHTFADQRDRELKDMDVRIKALQQHEKCVRAAGTAAALSACPAAISPCGGQGVR